ncbi:MAG: alginate lyase family protein, partial [Gemmatimonadaceae bacterium]
MDLNRHHWFATLGFAYWYSSDSRYLRAFIAESADWMDQYLTRLGRIRWDTPFQVASRVNAWIWAHYLFLPSTDWDAVHYTRFVRGLGLLTEYLDQTIEYHSPGNHILLEAKTLLLCGEAFPEFGGASRWRRRGWRILGAELQKQICQDGVHAERSTMYHRIVAGELAELWLFLRLRKDLRASVLEGVVRKMANFQRWIDQGGGQLPLFGDAYAEDTYYRFSAPALVAGNDRGAAQHLITESTDHTYWLLGGECKTPERPPDQVAAAASEAFHEGGYFVTRSPSAPFADVLVWDCGPVGFYRNRKHAHLDSLAFTLSIAGTPLLIDPGTSMAVELKETLRGTRAHSTLCIDGEEQGILAARGEIWSPPRPELVLWATSLECTIMSGRHDGYRRLREPVWHARTIVTMHGLYWLIVDCIEGSGVHLAEQRFHVAPGAAAALGADGHSIELSKGAARLSLKWAQDRILGRSPGKTPFLRVERSEAELRCGSPEQTQIVKANRGGSVPFALTVVASVRPDVLVSYAGAADDVITVTGPNFKHDVYLSSGSALTTPAGWDTDAPVVIVRSSGREKPQDMLLAGPSRLSRAGREYPLRAAENG